MNPIKVTTKNRLTVKRKLIRLACKIAKARDGYQCQFCGRASGKMDAAHVISRGRSWQAAMDPLNIVCLCVRCHTLGNPSWHSNAAWGWEQLRATCPDIARHVDELDLTVSRMTVGRLQEWADALVARANQHGVTL